MNKFASAKFLKAVSSFQDLPSWNLSEIVVAGKSNVGKSSFINVLVKDRHAAKVSSTPGKTQTINFFSIDEKIALVDIPGYGYAKVSKDLREQWASFLEEYFDKRKNIALILLLIDSRRGPDPQDLQFLEWIEQKRKKCLIILTKTDKKDSQNSFEELKKFPSFSFSIKKPFLREPLITTINSIIYGSTTQR